MLKQSNKFVNEVHADLMINNMVIINDGQDEVLFNAGGGSTSTSITSNLLEPHKSTDHSSAS